MKISKIRKSIACMSATAILVAATAILVPSAHAAGPTCTTKGKIETCTGALSSGAIYEIRMPSNFHGSLFIWNHGFRVTYPYPSYTPPNGKVIEELTAYSDNLKSDITKPMLASGRAVAAYDRKSNGGYGWNPEDGIDMIKDLIAIAKAKYPKIERVINYGSSGGGPTVAAFAEKYPDLVDASGILSGMTNVHDSLTSACDLFYIMSIFADPTIKGCSALGVSKGVAGHMAALGELGKIAAVLTTWSKNLGSPGLAYPAALAGSAIPQRSALLLMGLIAGLPTKSPHMDGISTSAVVAEHSINATVAILENFGSAAGTGTLAGQAIGELVGSGFYDNTKTNWASLLSESDAGRYNLGLSGDDAITAMLGVLKASPRVTGNPASVAKLVALGSIKHSSTKPMILLSNEVDRLVFVGNAVQFNDRAQAAHLARLATWGKTHKGARPQPSVLSLYALTPETYTKFTAAGLPDLSGPPAPSGVDHQSFTKAQMMMWASLLDISAQAKRLPSNAVLLKRLGKTPYMNTDLDFRPADLKYGN